MSVFMAASTLCLVLTSAVHGVDEPQVVDLEYTFRTGEPLRYEVSRRSVMSQSMGAQLSMMSESFVSDVTRERIGEKDDGSLIVRQVTNSFAYREATPAGEFDFDSSSEEDQGKRGDERVRGFYESLGWDIEYVLSPKGEVIGVENLDSLGERVGEIAQEDARVELEDTFSLDSLIQEVNPFMHLLPDEQVGKGDTWVSTFTIVDEGMEMTAKQNMLVQSVLDWKDGHYVGVKFEGDVDMQLPPEFPPFMEVTESTIEGAFVFNTHYGAVSDYNSTIKFVFSGTPGPGMDTVTLVMSLHMRYELQRD